MREKSNKYIKWTLHILHKWIANPVRCTDPVVSQQWRPLPAWVDGVVDILTATHQLDSHSTLTVSRSLFLEIFQRLFWLELPKCERSFFCCGNLGCHKLESNATILQYT